MGAAILMILTSFLSPLLKRGAERTQDDNDLLKPKFDPEAKFIKDKDGNSIKDVHKEEEKIDVKSLW